LKLLHHAGKRIGKPHGIPLGLHPLSVDFFARKPTRARAAVRILRPSDGALDDAPCIPLLGLGDTSTGVHAAFAILAAIYHRDRTGRGQQLDVALLDTYYHCHEVNVHQYSGTDRKVEPTRGGQHMSYVCPAGVFRAIGGDLILMGALHHWKDLCAAMDRPDLLTDERLGSDPGRVKNRKEVVDLIEKWLKTFPDRDSAIAHLEKHDVPVAPILTVAEIVDNPHLRQQGTVRTIDDRLTGKFDIPGMPVKFSDYPDGMNLEAATLGEHNEEIVTGLLGHGQKEFAELVADGVVVEKNI